MVEGPLILALIARAFHIRTVEGRRPVPVAHLTVRSEEGIWIEITPRAQMAG